MAVIQYTLLLVYYLHNWFAGRGCSRCAGGLPEVRPEVCWVIVGPQQIQADSGTLIVGRCRSQRSFSHNIKSSSI
ncbi:hypothetical protein BJ138DRAFT_1168354 [Hygrophoropsis aurantiaca]|uniref:Uncharacterized protein n=1 Tax=Hygrophoropsis aurantiaca TaxID=72124 RepID=A0ACB7ZQB7_9AGAM|nr:hypothetical protein BJ138DRAFT_1168354 [Hygrophoropsis aurantiaca]